MEMNKLRNDIDKCIAFGKDSFIRSCISVDKIRNGITKLKKVNTRVILGITLIV